MNALVAVSCLVLAMGCSQNPQTLTSPAKTSVASTDAELHELRIAAAADLKFVLGDITADFERQHPEVRVLVTYGSSGNFYAQLSNRAPFDVFLSADLDYPRKLIDAGLADQKTAFSYARGQLVVWIPQASPLNLEEQGIRALLDPRVRKIAIANPKHAPYGRAAEAALKNLGVYEQVSERLVLGENIAQATQFVESGAADLGVIALSLAQAPVMRNNGRFWLVPQAAYPMMEQGGIILSWTREAAAAQAFCQFLKEGHGHEILQSHGFGLPSMIPTEHDHE